MHTHLTNNGTYAVTFHRVEDSANCKAGKTTFDSMLNKLNEEITTSSTNDTSTNTKVPNTDVLQDGGLLEEDNNNDTEVSKDLGSLKDEDDGPTINPELP
jgi:hypothetical protein